MHNLPLECCCEELKTIFEEKEQKHVQLSNYWKQKTTQLISISQQEIQKLKNKQLQLHDNTHFEVKQMKQYLEAIIQNILKRQEDIVDVYTTKVQQQKKENKELVKRIVNHRNASGLKAGKGRK